MALTFGAATSDRVNHGTNSALSSINGFTVWVWVTVTTFTNARRFVSKYLNGVTAGFIFGLSGTSGAIYAEVVRGAGTQADGTSSTVLKLNVPHFVALTYGETNGLKLFIGSLGTPATEVAYASRNVGSGATPLNTVGAYIVGNNSNNLTQALQGRIALHKKIDAELTLKQLLEQQDNPFAATSGTMQLFTEYGWNGTGLQQDQSGRGNYGTVTGATYARAAALDTWFMPKRRLIFPQAIAAAGDAVPQVWAQYRRRRAA